MGQTDQSNNFIIYNISLHYDAQFIFNELGIQEKEQETRLTLQEHDDDDDDDVYRNLHR